MRYKRSVFFTYLQIKKADRFLFARHCSVSEKFGVRAMKTKGI
ncbi:hypothetical protein CYK57_00705 [Actinobacillus pleuropneumoniae]|nr:hypothetical protein CYK57_00705 [Actinobacillus pleuropneumoniae]